MRGLSSILSLFRKEFNKFNNTGARMLDSIYNMTLKIILKSYYWRENVRVLPYSCLTLNTSFHNVAQKSVNH